MSTTTLSVERRERKNRRNNRIDITSKNYDRWLSWLFSEDKFERVFEEDNKENVEQSNSNSNSNSNNYKFNDKKQVLDLRDEVLNDISEHAIIVGLSAPVFYKKVLTPTLLQAVEANLACPVSEQASLFQELAIIRELACDPIEQYGKAKNQYEVIKKELESNNLSDKDREGLQKLLSIYSAQKDACENNVVIVLERVSKFCEKAARIDALSREKFSIHTIHSLVVQLTMFAVDFFHKNGLDHLAVEYEEKVKENLVVPMLSGVNGKNIIDVNEEGLGTNLTPDLLDETVKLMDSLTVPSSSDSSNNSNNGNNGNGEVK